MTVHSDQGIQYQSNAYRHELKKHNIFQSMSRRATYHDNAAMESFFHTIKVEIDYYTHHFKTKKELIKRMESWIKYYNQERIKHKKKGPDSDRISKSSFKSIYLELTSNFRG